MGDDLTSGLDPEREYLFATKPDDPEMRESVNTWVWDDGAAFEHRCLPSFPFRRRGIDLVDPVQAIGFAVMRT